MAITVGLDFGTHQTKICIEDTADKQNPNYSFWKFKDVDGKMQFVCPSVVQLNEDNTLSYGYVSDENCKKGFHIEYTQPTMPILEEPVLELPTPPVPYIVPEIDEKGLSELDVRSIRERKREIKLANHTIADNHKAICGILEKRYKEKLNKYLESKSAYETEYARWEHKTTTPSPIRYFYFKQAVFSELEWRYKDTSPTLLSIWYLANIIFDLEEKYGKNFALQMGVPTGAKDFQKKKQIATSIVLSAYRLVEDMFNNDKQAFLASTIDELIVLTDIVPYSDEAKHEYGILVFPEAYAGLRMMTARGKIVRGMNLNVDIGGGTTDISFFVINNGRPNIYRYESMPQGLNWIVQDAFGDSAILKKRTYLDFNAKSEQDKKALILSIGRFFNSITSIHSKITKMLWNEWVEKMGTANKHRLTSALQNRPIIYMGGGSTYSQLRKAVGAFSDVHIVDDEFWSGIQIENVGDMCPVLNTALGLSVGETDDNIEIHSISDLWSENANMYERSYEKVDYNLMDV